MGRSFILLHDSGFQGAGFCIPMPSISQKISWIPECGLPYMRREWRDLVRQNVTLPTPDVFSLQVSYHRPVLFSAIATQGSSDYDQWVASYTLSYSEDGSKYSAYNIGGQRKVGGNFQYITLLGRKGLPCYLLLMYR